MPTTQAGYQHILVATDFSPAATAALQQAVWLARQTGATLTVAHTLPDLRRVVHSASAQAKLDLLYGEGEQFQREVRRVSDARLRQAIADLGVTDLHVDYETLLGEPFVEITHAVQQEGYDLVIVGTRGLAAWEQFLVGSTAKRLIRKCPAAVWIVKAEHVGPPKVVLGVTDFSDASVKAVQHGLWVAQQSGAQFHLLHVVDSADVPDDLLSRVPDGSSLRKEIDDEARHRLDKLLASLPPGTPPIQPHLSWGTPWKEIQRLAQHLKADLVTIGTVGRSGIAGLLLGNTAEKVLDSVDCSVLTVKPDGYVSPIQPACYPLHPGSKQA